MKLLSPQQVRDIKEQELARRAMRVKEMDEIERKSRLSLSKYEGDFALAMANFKEQRAKEEEDHENRVKEMRSEIIDLENQRKTALQPIELIKIKYEERLRDAEEDLKNIKDKEEKLDDLQDRLEDKLDELGGKEILLDERDIKQQMAQQGIDQQKGMIIANNQRLGLEMAEFAKNKALAEKTIDENRTVLFLKERSLLAKEESLKRTEQKLIDWDRKLKDERGTLERAFARIKNK